MTRRTGFTRVPPKRTGSHKALVGHHAVSRHLDRAALWLIDHSLATSSDHPRALPSKITQKIRRKSKNISGRAGPSGDGRIACGLRPHNPKPQNCGEGNHPFVLACKALDRWMCFCPNAIGRLVESESPTPRAEFTSRFALDRDVPPVIPRRWRHG